MGSLTEADPPVDGARPFYAILTRGFVRDWMNRLSSGAIRVYAYLRTWCTSAAGEASAWVTLRVRKIATDLRWSPRYVFRALAELRSHRLIEREHQVDEDGQHANRYRVPASEERREEAPRPAKGRDGGPGAAPRDILPRADVYRLVAAAVDAAAEALPGWAEAAAEEAEEAAEQAANTIAYLETERPPNAATMIPSFRADQQAAIDRAAGYRRQAHQPVRTLLTDPTWRNAVSHSVVTQVTAALQRRGIRHRSLRSAILESIDQHLTSLTQGGATTD